MPNPDKPYCVEVDASNYATRGILAQPGADEQWHLVAYLSKFLLEPKHNYDIHDKELLATAKFVYNDREHSATKVTPFFADMGRHPYKGTAPKMTLQNETVQEFANGMRKT